MVGGGAVKARADILVVVDTAKVEVSGTFTSWPPL